MKWFRLVKWSQVVLHLNLSLRALWPHAFIRRRLIVSHQSGYVSGPDGSGARDWWRRLKLHLMRRATNIAASRAIAAALPVACHIIPNPYDSAIFNQNAASQPNRDLLFVGRLVSEKGVGLLLTALARVEPPWHTARLTIVGDGPERASLENQALQLDLSERVRFLGALNQDRVADQMRRHRILVVPSTYAEPFGVVALEGAACGCVVLGSDGGGLPSAIGPSGLTFRRGDAAHLARQLTCLLGGAAAPLNARPAVASHLRLHDPRRIAAEYAKFFGHSALRA